MQIQKKILQLGWKSCLPLETINGETNFQGNLYHVLFSWVFKCENTRGHPVSFRETFENWLTVFWVWLDEV